DEAAIEQRSQNVRPRPVRVELHAQSERARLCEEVGQIRLKRRLPARDDDAVEKPATIAEAFDHVGDEEPWTLDLTFRQDEIGVVAERAAEVAAANEDDGRNVAFMIGKRKRNEGTNVHGVPLQDLLR
ncbi:MAG: hypothetical protein NTV92_08910, partial [Candidatus Bipolaricaulota bacterium]|nr:hypothetical protein [Candidatus Bipolaricaulota bacterium]